MNRQVKQRVTRKKIVDEDYWIKKHKIIWHNDFIMNIFEGKVIGKKSWGRLRKQYFNHIQVIQLMNCTCFILLRRVASTKTSSLIIDDDEFYAILSRNEVFKII